MSDKPADIADVLGRAIERDAVPTEREDQIQHMVRRFLAWRLPDDFNPDGGISFVREYNKHTAFATKCEPSGTNLLDATQADAMVRHMLEGLPAPDARDEADKACTAAGLPRLMARIENSMVGTLDTLGEFEGIDRRWLAIGRTQIELGFMALERAVKPILPTATAPTVETGWVIERAGSYVSAPDYWPVDSSSTTWTRDHLQAMRFSREIDAASFARGHIEDEPVRICEHQWG